MKLYQRLRDCAVALQDEQLLANLRAGDSIAQVFKYHPACQAALYNRETERGRAMRQEDECHIKDASLKEITLAELVSYF